MDDPTKCETGRLQCHTDIFCSLRPFGETFYFARMNKGKWEVSSRAGFMWECDFISKKWKFFFLLFLLIFFFHIFTQKREKEITRKKLGKKTEPKKYKILKKKQKSWKKFSEKK